MTFAHPAYLLLLLLLVPLIGGYVLLRRWQEPALRIGTTRPLRALPMTPVTALVHLPFVLRMLAGVALVLILARPQTSQPLFEREVEGIDIMIAMDISVSMLTPDLRPNRIEAAKQVAGEFIAAREHDNIGLTLFGGEAFTQCPMTTDHAALLSMFQQVSCDLQESGVIADGTAIGMGLTNAVSHLAESRAPSKVVILITDGANNTGEISPLTAAEVAKRAGVRVYTIAVGQQGVIQRPMGTLPNGEMYYAPVQSDMDPETLRSIAKTTGGMYYAAASNDKLRAIYADIDKMERRKLKVQHFQKRYEAYEPLAWVVLACLLLDVLLRLTVLKRIP